MKEMNEPYYFTADGSYGWISPDSVMETEHWVMSDWEEIENCTDSERAFVARGIASKYASN